VGQQYPFDDVAGQWYDCHRLTYYYDHQAEIDAEIRLELAEVRTAQANALATPFELRMQAKDILNNKEQMV
jgi:hypothetical protein